MYATEICKFMINISLYLHGPFLHLMMCFSFSLFRDLSRAMVIDNSDHANFCWHKKEQIQKADTIYYTVVKILN